MSTQVTDLPVLPPRATDAHKGRFGRLLIVAGSPGLTGAGSMTAEGAQRAGAGLVTVAAPDGLNFIYEVKLTSAMSHPLPPSGADALGREAADAVLEMADRYDVVALGPGVGREMETVEAVCRLVRELVLPVVIDADGLYALAQDPSVLERAPGPRLLTPHPGEMARLVGMAGPAEVQENRTGVATAFAGKYGVVLALKGADTVVTDGVRQYVNPSGNPGLATGGSGDVLTGMAAGLLGQGLDPFAALVLAVFAHGLAGDFAAQDLGQAGMIPEDVLARAPQAFRALGRLRTPADAELVWHRALALRRARGAV